MTTLSGLLKLKEQASKGYKIPESNAFRVWKVISVVIGMGLHTALGLYFLKEDARLFALQHLVIWNILILYGLVIAKFLRYLTKWYKIFYFLIPLSPILWQLMNYVFFFIMLG